MKDSNQSSPHSHSPPPHQQHASAVADPEDPESPPSAATMIRPLLTIAVATVSLAATSEDSAFPVAPSDVPLVAIRKYTRDSRVAQACCGAPILGLCLQSASSRFTSLEDALAKRKKEVDKAIIMMTSSKLRSEYAVYSEATVARFIETSDASSPWDFLSVEVNDASGVALDGRAPHWLKVPVMYYTSRQYRSALLYLDADTSIVFSKSMGWLDALLRSTAAFDLVLTKDAEGPDELIFEEGGQARLNDATYVNTGVMLLRNERSDDGPTWTDSLLRGWWLKGSDGGMPVYKNERTFDQGALGHLFFTEGAPQHGPNQERSNRKKNAWREHYKVLKPEIFNNHAPGGSFRRPKTNSDTRQWWCQHFLHPVLQLSGQSNEVRRSVLRRIWLEGGACKEQEQRGAGAGAGDGPVWSLEVGATGEVEAEGGTALCPGLGM
jgi:hypothetical protein